MQLTTEAKKKKKKITHFHFDLVFVCSEAVLVGLRSTELLIVPFVRKQTWPQRQAQREEKNDNKWTDEKTHKGVI